MQYKGCCVSVSERDNSDGVTCSYPEEFLHEPAMVFSQRDLVGLSDVHADQVGIVLVLLTVH